MTKTRRALAGVALAMSAALIEMLIGSPATADTPFADGIYKSTHNSYSGGARGTILQQLDRGVRQVEFDVHEDNAARFVIGHDGPGDEVDYTGDNPDTDVLSAWLYQVKEWSDQHADHAPLTITLDLKDDLTDNRPFQGDLNDLNSALGIFGANLVWANDKEPASLPSVDALRGRVIVVLSGDERTRTLYRRDTGQGPGVAMNSHGQVVEFHQSENTGQLWFWTGQYRSDGRIDWLHHENWSEVGILPAVALNDSGNVVVVYKLQNSNQLNFRVGQLLTDGYINWGTSGNYDNGLSPTIKFTSPTSTTLREIHRNQANTQNYSWNAKVVPNQSGSLGLSWSGVAKTSEGFFPREFAINGTRQVTVFTQADGATPAKTLGYRTDRVAKDRIRYQQMAFVEYQKDNPTELKQGALFYAVPASDKEFIKSNRRLGKIVRGWKFGESDETDPLANFPATDEPNASWYVDLMARKHAVQ